MNILIKYSIKCLSFCLKSIKHISGYAIHGFVISSSMAFVSDKSQSYIKDNIKPKTEYVKIVDTVKTNLIQVDTFNIHDTTIKFITTESHLKLDTLLKNKFDTIQINYQDNIFQVHYILSDSIFVSAPIKLDSVNHDLLIPIKNSNNKSNLKSDVLIIHRQIPHGEIKVK